MGTTPIRVLVVDDQHLVRRGIARLLDLDPAVEVVGEADDGDDALEMIALLMPQVVLVDARMPRMNGVELVEHLTDRYPTIAAIVLTTFDDEEYVLGGLRAGARGYLLKDTSPEDLVDAIGRVHHGETVLGGAIAARVVSELRRPTTHPEERGARSDGLTDREVEVLGLLGTGATNEEIAERLFIGLGTTRNHVSSILRKLGLRHRTEAALYAIEQQAKGKASPQRG